MGQTEESVRRSARVLAAFMTDTEAMGFASSFAIEPAQFMSAWGTRGAARAALARTYTPPKVEDLPASMTAHVDAIRAHQVFPLAYGPTATFKMVELGKLLAFQYWMDTDVSTGVHAAGVDGPPDQEHLLRTCLPPDVVPPLQTRWEGIQNGIAVYSMNNSFAARGPIVDQAKGQIVFVVGAMPNLMLVREHAGRYILANGYHRAWMLRSRGVSMAPVVLVNVPNIADVVPPVGFVQPATLFGPCPPLVDDFLDDSLSVSVDVRATLRMVRITAETSSVPRLI